MLVKIEDIISGDEIIISWNSKLKYLKVLTTPVLGNRDLWGIVIDNNGRRWEKIGKKYKSLRCSLRQDEIPIIAKSGISYIHKNYVFEQDVSKHNKKVNIDLNNRDIYLVKREEIKKEQIF